MAGGLGQSDAAYLPLIPEQGFFVAVNNPVRGRGADEVHLYALHTSAVMPDEDVQISKTGGLLSTTVKTNSVQAGGLNFGCFVEVGLSNRLRGLRYGFYTAKFEGNEEAISRYGFVKIKSSKYNLWESMGCI